MKKNLLVETIMRNHKGRPPIWFLGQNGAHRPHYRSLRGEYSYLEICQTPEISAEVSLSPTRDLTLDAAVLQTDPWLPLQALGMEMKSMGERAELGWKLKSHAELDLLISTNQAPIVDRLEFQERSIKRVKSYLPHDSALVGIAPGPISLFLIAVHGSSAVATATAAEPGGLDCLKDGRMTGFLAKASMLLIENMARQAQAGVDTISILDPLAGLLEPGLYREIILPSLSFILSQFKIRFPDVPLTYHSRGTGPLHWDSLRGLPIDALGVDENHELPQVLTAWSDRFVIYGNINPGWLALEEHVFEPLIRALFAKVRSLPLRVRSNWICGLGDTMHPNASEKNIRFLIQLADEVFTPLR